LREPEASSRPAPRDFDTGQGRKTDAADAHAIVMVALRDKELREFYVNPELMVLRMLWRPR
jgi:transposase